MKKILCLLLLLSCGIDQAENQRNMPPPISDLKSQILALQAELSSIAATDYASCGGALSTAVQNICKIAQAAMIEGNIATYQAMNDLTVQLESKIKNSASDFTAMSASWKQIYGSDFPSVTAPSAPTLSECQTNTGNASILGCISKFSTDIQTIQSQISVLTGSITGTMTSVEVGKENILAGPYYEQLARLSDKSKINAYTDGTGPTFTVGNNPINASNGSNTVTITITAHGMSNGDKIAVEDCQSGRGFTWQHLNGRFVIAGVTANTFTVVLPGTASSNGTLGGATCIIEKFSGAGMSTIWINTDASDVAVRTTTGGTKSYNFAICKNASQGFVCYDSTNRSATFATISAGWGGACAGSGNILCK